MHYYHLITDCGYAGTTNHYLLVTSRDMSAASIDGLLAQYADDDAAAYLDACLTDEKYQDDGLVEDFFECCYANASYEEVSAEQAAELAPHIDWADIQLLDPDYTVYDI